MIYNIYLIWYYDIFGYAAENSVLVAVNYAQIEKEQRVREGKKEGEKEKDRELGNHPHPWGCHLIFI